MKILISRGFGAGWSSWSGDREAARFSLVYAPLIAHVEEHGSVGLTERHPLIQQFLTDLEEETGCDYFYVGGANHLVVVDVDLPFKVDEYDGSESVTMVGDDDWWRQSDFKQGAES